jgi:endonuclease YncB( thermonuclease family)
MLTWKWTVLLALALVVGGAVYIRLRWRRAPQAYRAMVALAACFFVAGSLTGAWLLHLAAPKDAEVATVKADNATPSVSASSVPAAELNRFSAKVAGVTDGDTVDVLKPDGLTYSIRLAGIDAPESAQAFGSQSTQQLAGLISGKTVTLECENEWSYGRLICKIILPSGEDVCLDQVKAGMAWHYKQYQDEQGTTDHQAYASAECAAMKSKIGLWSDPHEVYPRGVEIGERRCSLPGGDAPWPVEFE